MKKKSSESEYLDTKNVNETNSIDDKIEKSKSESVSSKANNLNLWGFAFVATFFVSTILVLYDLKDSKSFIPILLSFGAVTAIVIVTSALITFLEPEKNKKNRSLPVLQLVRQLLKSAITIRLGITTFDDEPEEVKPYAASFLSDEERERIVTNIQKELEQHLHLEANANLLEKLASTSKQFKVDDFFNESRDRIITETASQSKRGDLNLIIGILTALIGVGFLVYTVLSSTEKHDITDFISHFAPRASVVLLIEVFAYFFLKLYKNSLDEIKYFQNELTNLESKYLAILLLDNDNESSDFSSTISSLINTERNFILQKGQSTILLEKDKNASKSESRIFSLLEKVVQKK